MRNPDRNIAPVITESVDDVNMPIAETFRLDNGVPVTMINNGVQDVHRLSVMWDGGNVEASSPSVANLTAQLLREGTRNLTGEDISNNFEHNGAWVKCLAQSHNTSVVLHALNHTVDKVYPTLHDMITAPIFPVEALKTVQESMAANLETNLRRVDYLSQLSIRDMIFGKEHRMSRKETPDDIRRLSQRDLSEFHSRYMKPNKMHIYLTGKINGTLLNALNRCLGSDKLAAVVDDNELILEPARLEENMIDVVHVDGASQSSVRMAIPAIERNHPDYIPLRLTTVALGGYFGSRLMTNIREDKGLTYGINAGLYGYREGSMVMIGAQTSNETVGELIEETKNEIERLKTGDMSQDELVRMQRFMRTQLLTQLDTPFAIMDYYETLHINDIKGDYFQQQWSEINNVSVEKIGEMASKYLNTDIMRIAVAGNSELINI